MLESFSLWKNDLLFRLDTYVHKFSSFNSKGDFVFVFRYREFGKVGREKNSYPFLSSVFMPCHNTAGEAEGWYVHGEDR